MVEIEILLARTFGWSLHDIDETDAGSLMNFIQGLGKKNQSVSTETAPKPARRVYCDQVDWL